ncbi:Aste57867_12838 [Aphanomyces stellatus]|uniref:Aste57867_12838 protein n=1 Tax=Aphanomyces stellatus TaxID=120398 RepID=A0A485KY77_9STRA|nr:hypothetical protein As57867_012790 [Aphanomyces stellatus]VFT89685.1 Aste57867_12838 [Aphanomyces stellatus]
MLLWRATSPAILRPRPHQSVVFFTSKSTPPPTAWLSSILTWFKPPPPAPDAPTTPFPTANVHLDDGLCLLIDGNNLIYHQYKKYMEMKSTPQTGSEYIGATYGFLKAVDRLLVRFEPRRVCVFFDTPVVTNRKLDDPTYKATRGRTPDALRTQFPLTQSTLARIGVAVVKVDGIEADDLIASYTKANVAEGFDVVIVSDDKDFYQLLQSTPQRVTLYRPSWDRVYDEAFVKRILSHGQKNPNRVTPAMYPSIITLKGDRWGKSPGLPGGLGTKLKPIKYAFQSGGVLPLLGRLSKIREKDLRKRFKDSADVLTATYRSLKLDDTIARPVSTATFAVDRIDMDQLAAILGNPKRRILHHQPKKVLKRQHKATKRRYQAKMEALRSEAAAAKSLSVDASKEKN